jgi:squamous cell carcinoma antigen recognized by T-cells 3
MDQPHDLDALASILTRLAENPYDYEAHVRHIRLLKSAQDADSDLIAAIEMMANFYAIGEDLWSILIENKKKSVDLRTANGVGELLALYERAEADYLCAYGVP